MKRSMIGLFIFMLLVMKGFAMEEIINAIPRDILGWQAEQPDESYDRETLYDYIDGGAELYLTYDFRQVMVRRYSKPNAPEIELGIYEMGSPQDAYGIFSAERQDEDIGIGQDSEYGGGLLRFWKGRYFVTALAIGDEEVARPAILALGHGVAQAISQPGERPSLLNLLPKESLIPNTIRFFHSYQVLNRQYFLSEDNILNLDNQTDALFAPYQTNGSKSFLLLIHYPDSLRAKKAFDSFVLNYLPEARFSGWARMENGTWTVARVRDRLVMIVFEALEKNWAEELLARVIGLLDAK